jgi:hypothetical protein
VRASEDNAHAESFFHSLNAGLTPARHTCASIAGTYHLVSINGNALPFTAQAGTTTIIVTSDVLTVADGGTWTESGAYAQTINGVTSNQVVTDGGAWSRLSATVSFADANKVIAYAGQITGSGFNLSNTNYSYVFTP